MKGKTLDTFMTWHFKKYQQGYDSWFVWDKEYKGEPILKII